MKYIMPTKAQTANLGILRFLLAAIVLLCGCDREPRPLSIDKVLNANIPVPIHRTGPDSDYRELRTTYYYSEGSSEMLLTTYFFIKNSEDQNICVARMITCRHCGQLVNIDEVRGQALSSISWARGATGICSVYSSTYESDSFDVSPFQSCLYWFDENGNAYKLYTIWPKEEAVNFANSLLMLRE